MTAGPGLWGIDDDWFGSDESTAYLERAASLMEAETAAMWRGDLPAQRALAEELLELALEYVGPDSSTYAAVLGSVATVSATSGEYDHALRLFEEAATMYRRHDDDVGLAVSLHGISHVAKETGRYDLAREALTEALDIDRRVYGRDSTQVAGDRCSLGALLAELGAYHEAERLFETGLRTLRDAFESRRTPSRSGWFGRLTGRADADGSFDTLAAAYSTALRLAGSLSLDLGRYHEADTRLRTALSVLESEPGVNNLAAADVHNGFGRLFSAAGDLDDAERSLERAHELRSGYLPPTHPHHVGTLVALADVRLARELRETDGDDGQQAYLTAASIYRSALGTLEATGQTGRPQYPMVLTRLADAEAALGDVAGAVERYETALDLFEAIEGPAGASRATTLRELGLLHARVDEFELAEVYLDEALASLSRQLGDEHEFVARTLFDLAVLYVFTDREADALAALERSGRILDAVRAHVFAIGDIEHRRTFLTNTRNVLDLYLTLATRVAAPDSDTTERAFDFVLRRKGLDAEATRRQRTAVLGRRSPELRALLASTDDLAGRIAREVLDGPPPDEHGREEFESTVRGMVAELRDRERELARAIPEYEAVTVAGRPDTTERRDVAAALPHGGVLVEYATFSPVYPGPSDTVPETWLGQTNWVAWGEWARAPAELLAFVLRSDAPDAVTMVPLGDLRTIERRLISFSRAVETDDVDLLLREGRVLRQLVFDPLLESVGDGKRLVVAPDGPLYRLAFELLSAENSSPVSGAGPRYLIDEYTISYVTTGRDVLGFGGPVRSPGRPTVIAAPDYDYGGGGHLTPGPRRGLRVGTFTPLEHAKDEGQAVADRLGVVALTDTEATESAVESVRSPNILHVATHGFVTPPGLGPENPMLRSGLALAGANTWAKGYDLPPEAGDGLLLASDVVGLDLLDCELVVLSACLTGRGEVYDREGVYGLRRGFVVAGARSAVLSLWKVPDEPTRALMAVFYDELIGGASRIDALRRAQLAVRANGPPRWWGAFVLQGDPGPLAGVTDRNSRSHETPGRWLSDTLTSLRRGLSGRTPIARGTDRARHDSCVPEAVGAPERLRRARAAPRPRVAGT